MPPRPINLPAPLNSLKIGGGQLGSALARVDVRAVFNFQRQTRLSARPFVLLDGPPYANGSLHTGHFLNKTLKDIILRHRVLTGRRVEYRPGWDCHGLPIELKAKAASPGAAKSSPMQTRTRARAFAEKAMAEQKSDFKSWQLLADWDAYTYNTMSAEYEVAELGVLKRLVDAGLVQRKNMPVNWSPGLQTALAESEIEYGMRTSTAAYIGFPCTAGFAEAFGSGDPIHAVVWTTTPWSIVGNAAVAVHPDLGYVAVAAKGARYIVAQERASALAVALGASAPDDATRVVVVRGSVLVGGAVLHPVDGSLRPVIAAAHVGADSGTGLVHIAPAHGVEDWEAMPDTVARCFVDESGAFAGLPVELGGERLNGLKVLSNAATTAVLELLGGHVVAPPSAYEHRYPFDWREKKPVITRLAPQWFVNAAPGQAGLVDKVERFVPPAGERRLRAFLQTQRKHGWCLSRQRAWGLPIPAFVRGHGDAQETLLTSDTVASFAAATERHGGSDVWFDRPPPPTRPGDDDDDDDPLLPPQHRGQGWRRAFDTLDVWFDSGAAWALLLGEHGGKADLVIEGSDQHRGWFQASLLSRGDDDAPFRAIMTHGFVLDDKARKMSKSLGNVVAPVEAIKMAGSIDALRLWVALGDVGGDVALSPKAVRSATEALFKLVNTQKFLVLNTASRVPDPDAPLELMDRHVLGLLRALARDVDACFEGYDVRGAVRHVLEFVSGDWATAYLDAVKDRLYCEPAEASRRDAAVRVLREMLRVLCTCVAPVIPNSAEDVFAASPHGLFPPLPAGAPASIFLTGSRSGAVASEPETAPDAATVMEIRMRTNRLFEGAKRSVKALGVRVTLQQPLHEAWTAPASPGAQWTALEEAIGVARATVCVDATAPHAVAVAESAIDGECARCERCRRFHASVRDGACARCG